jgi:hypothetical protein
MSAQQVSSLMEDFWLAKFISPNANPLCVHRRVYHCSFPKCTSRLPPHRRHRILTETVLSLLIPVTFLHTHLVLPIHIRHGYISPANSKNLHDTPHAHHLRLESLSFTHINNNQMHEFFIIDTNINIQLKEYSNTQQCCLR